MDTPNQQPIAITDEIATLASDHTISPSFFGILQNADPTIVARGGFDGVSIYDEIERDNHAFGQLQKRALAVVARPWVVEAASKSPLDQRAADAVTQAISGFAFDRLTVNLLDSLLKGYAVAEVMWKIEPGKGVTIDETIPRRQRRFVFDDDRKLRLLTRSEPLRGIELPERKFIVATYGGKDGTPYGLGLGTRLFWPVFFKRMGIKFWLTFADKFGNPTAVGKYPTGTADDKLKVLKKALQSLSQNTGVTIPDGLVIELLEAQRSGSIDTYERLCRYMDEQIDMAVLGSADTKSSGGALAAASLIKNEVRLELTQADADLLSDVLNKTLVTWLTEFNVPGATPPKLSRKVQAPEDLEARARRDKTIGEMGFEASEEYIRTTYGGDWTRKKTPAIPAAFQRASSNPDPSFAAGEQTDPTPVTAMADQLTTTAAPAMRDMLDSVRKLVENAPDLPTLRDQLVNAYGNLPSAQLVDVMSLAFSAAHLAGMHDVSIES